MVDAIAPLPPAQVNFFILAVQFMTELNISLRRIDAFLSIPEPPPPVHQHAGSGAAPGEVRLRGADYAWGAEPPPAEEGTSARRGGTGRGQQGPARAEVQLQVEQQQAQGSEQGAAPGRGSMDAAAAAAAPPGGAQEGQGSVQPPRAAAGPAQADASVPQRITLHGVSFQLAPGELLGVCGEVGSGKSSLLAALLGELQPLQPEGGRRGPGLGALPLVRWRPPLVAAACLLEHMLPRACSRAAAPPPDRPCRRPSARRRAHAGGQRGILQPDPLGHSCDAAGQHHVRPAFGGRAVQARAAGVRPGAGHPGPAGG